jgi:NADH-quinone oxidoreductase subunit J
MLTNRIAGKPLRAESHHVMISALITLSLFLLIVVAYQKTSFAPWVNLPSQGNSINQIGIELMSTYVAPFEIAGVLLLVCLIGAAVMASSINKNDHV